MKQWKMASISVVIIMIIISLCGFFLFWEEKPTITQYDSVTIAITPSFQSSLIIIAHDNGYFRDNGLNVTLIPFDGGKYSLNALLNEPITYATASDFVAANYIFENPDLQIVTSIAEIGTNQIVIRKDLGIERPDQLRGKTIGLVRNSSSEYFLDSFLTMNNLSFSDVILKDLKPDDMIQAISNGSIDAACSWEPNIYHINQQLGMNQVSWKAGFYRKYFFLLISTKEKVKKYQDVTKRVVRSIILAEMYIDSHQDTAQDIVARYLKINNSEIRSIWSDNDYSISLDQALIMAMEKQADWMIRNNQTIKRKIPNYLDNIYYDAVGAEKPESITIIR